MVSVLAQALKAGNPAIQIRERDLCANELFALVGEIAHLAVAVGSQVLINDRIDVALSFDGVGIHLRSDSIPVAVARRLIGPNRLLGVSTHSLSEAVEAERGGADYIVLGPIYATPSKQIYGPPLGLATLERTVRAVNVPVFGIGGVTARRARDMRAAGAFGVAVITAVLRADEVDAATRALFDAVTGS